MKKYLTAIIALTAVFVVQTGCANIQPVGESSVLSSSLSADGGQKKPQNKDGGQGKNAAPNKDSSKDKDAKSGSSSSSASIKQGTAKLAKVTAISGSSITVKFASQPSGKDPDGANGKPDGQPPQGKQGQPPQGQPSGGGNADNSGKAPPNGGRQNGFNFDGEEKTITVTDQSIIFAENGKEQTAAKLTDIKAGSILELKYTDDKLVSIVIRPAMTNDAPNAASGAAPLNKA